MKKQFILLAAFTGLQVCLLTLNNNIATACDSKCNAASFKIKTNTVKEATVIEEENIDSRIHPFPFSVI